MNWDKNIIPKGMTAKEYYDNTFNMEWMNDDERELVYKATELYAHGINRHLKESLTKIAQMSDSGSPEKAIVDMKRIAVDALSSEPNDERSVATEAK